MPAPVRKKNSPAEEASVYRGRQTRTGNSSGLRFEGALFKSHPEFNGEVRAHVIAPGRMLVIADPAKPPKSDPVMESFLAFLAQDLAAHPETVRPLDAARVRRLSKLTENVSVDADEDLGDEILL